MDLKALASKGSAIESSSNFSNSIRIKEEPLFQAESVNLVSQRGGGRNHSSVRTIDPMLPRESASIVVGITHIKEEFGSQEMTLQGVLQRANILIPHINLLSTTTRDTKAEVQGEVSMRVEEDIEVTAVHQDIKLML